MIFIFDSILSLAATGNTVPECYDYRISLRDAISCHYPISYNIHLFRSLRRSCVKQSTGVLIRWWKADSNCNILMLLTFIDIIAYTVWIIHAWSLSESNLSGIKSDHCNQRLRQAVEVGIVTTVWNVVITNNLFVTPLLITLGLIRTFNVIKFRKPVDLLKIIVYQK